MRGHTRCHFRVTYSLWDRSDSSDQSETLGTRIRLRELGSAMSTVYNYETTPPLERT